MMTKAREERLLVALLLSWLRGRRGESSIACILAHCSAARRLSAWRLGVIG